jgi:surfactin synthase thioesterase subunit
MTVNSRVQSAGAGAIIAFPAAGGGKWLFTGLRQALPPGVRLITPELPGRGRRASGCSVRTMPDLVELLCGDLQALVGDRRYVIFGSCFGSLVSFELLRGLRRRRLPLPDAFLVSARMPPDLAPGYQQYADWQDEQLREYLDLVWPEQNPSKAVSDLRAVILGYLKRDIEIGASHEFRHEDPFELPIYAYRGDADWSVSPEELKTWEAHTSGPFIFRAVRGSRDFYLEDHGQLIADVTELLT